MIKRYLKVIEWSGKTVNRDRVSDGGCGEHLYSAGCFACMQCADLYIQVHPNIIIRAIYKLKAEEIRQEFPILDIY